MTTVSYGMRIYGAYNTYQQAKGYYQQIADGVSLRNVVLGFAVDTAFNYGVGKAFGYSLKFLKAAGKKVYKIWRGSTRVSAAPASAISVRGRGVLALPAPSKWHKHHIFPKQFKEWFENKGIDIDAFTIKLEVNTHLRGVHGKGGFVGAGSKKLLGYWNKKWQRFINNNKGASPEEIYQFAGKLLDEFGLGDVSIGPY